MTEYIHIDTETAADEILDAFYAAQQRKHDRFVAVSTEVGAAVFIFATLASHVIIGYSWTASLLLALIGAALWEAGAWTGYDAFDDWIEVRSPK